MNMSDRRKRHKSMQVNSLRALGRAFGVSHGAARKWTRRHDWPFDSEGPWIVEEVRVWREANLRPDRAEGRQAGKPRPPAFAAAELIYKRRVAALLQLKIKEKRKKLHDVAACRERRIRQVRTVREDLQNLFRKTATEISAEAADHLKKKLDEIAQRYADGLLEGP